MTTEHKPTENPDAEIATRHEEAAPGAASGGTRVSESPGVSSPQDSPLVTRAKIDLAYIRYCEREAKRLLAVMRRKRRG